MRQVIGKDHSGSDLFVFLLHPVVAHRLVFAGVGFDLRAIQRHPAQFHRSGFPGAGWDRAASPPEYIRTARRVETVICGIDDHNYSSNSAKKCLLLSVFVEYKLPIGFADFPIRVIDVLNGRQRISKGRTNTTLGG
jgi:hypothetical protein